MPYTNDHGVELWYDVNGVGEPVVVTGGYGLLHINSPRFVPS